MTDAKKLNVEWIAVGISLLNILVTGAMFIWWGGRLSQRVDTIEITQRQMGENIAANSKQNNDQDVAIAVNTSQYSEIVRRLSSIESKLDAR